LPFYLVTWRITHSNGPRLKRFIHKTENSTATTQNIMALPTAKDKG
jgi:hypothetical protein